MIGLAAGAGAGAGVWANAIVVTHTAIAAVMAAVRVMAASVRQPG